MVRRTCISYIYDLFFGCLHTSLFSGICKIGYGDQRLKKEKKKKSTKKRKTKNAEDQKKKKKKKGQRFDINF